MSLPIRLRSWPKNGLFACILVLANAGCGTFHREWKTAATNSPPAGSIEGRWDGNWKSYKNGHRGRLRCLITEVSDGKYNARFHANYWKIFTFGYSVPLQVRRVDGTNVFEGEANLSKFAGGRYEYAGDSTSDRFFSTYRCSRDHGIFEMKRPPPGK
jgi:hypothetical protein